MPKIINLKVSERGDGKNAIIFSQVAATAEELETVSAEAKSNAPKGSSEKEIEAAAKKALANIPDPFASEVFFFPRKEKTPQQEPQQALLVFAFAKSDTVEAIASLPNGSNGVKMGYSKDFDFVAIRGRDRIRHTLHTLGEGTGRPTVMPELASRIRDKVAFIL